MYTEKERNIYKIPQSTISVDPLEVRRRLMIGAEGKLHELIIKFNEGDSELEKAKAEDKLVEVARSAFKVKAVSEGGPTDAVVLEYLAHFLEWLSSPSRIVTKTSPTSQPCTGCP
jgi:hypothetical protein